MTKNYIIRILATVLVATSFLSGCARDNVQKSLLAPADNKTETLIDTSFLPDDATSRVNYDKVNGILSFGARTKLADGTYLQTQLFYGDKPETWWPADRLVQVKDGMWQISARLGENGAPLVLSTDGSYTLEVWEKGAPSNAEESLHFDLEPPPSPRE